MLIFPFIVFVLLFLGIYRRYVSVLGLRAAFLSAVVAWGMLLVLLTETLSAYHLLSFPYVSVSWIMLTWLGLLFCVLWPADRAANPADFNLKEKFFRSLKALHSIEMIMLLLIGLILFLVALTALLAPPNNWDSLVYHMGRVSHWVQNKSVEPYTTNIKTQIYYPPFAEWVILHLQILAESDRFANMVQWFAMCASAVAATLMGKYFGLSRAGQIFCGLLSLTVPMGIVQGSSTQNDYVLSLWLIIFVFFALQFTEKGKGFDAMMAGGALGLAFLTKAVAAILALPFVLWFFVAGIKRHRLKIVWPLIGIVILVGALNFNHLRRNFELCGNVLGEESVFGITRNEKMDPAFFVSNVVRNAGLHLATPSKSLNRLTEKGIEGLHKMLKVNSVDPATTLGETPLQISVSTHEDVAGNFFQLVLMVAAIGLICCRGKKCNPVLRNYGGALIGAIVLFNLLLKWQPAGSRLHLPVFILAMPFIGAAFFTLEKRRNAVIFIVTALLLTTSTPYVLRNSTRKLFSSKKTVFVTPRLRQYFAADDTLLPPYQAAVDLVWSRGCHDVGLRTGDNSWEYPFAVLFKQKPKFKVRLEQVDVPGLKPVNYPLGDFLPCAIIETGRTVPDGLELNINGKIFTQQFEQSPVRVYFSETHAP